MFLLAILDNFVFLNAFQRKCLAFATFQFHQFYKSKCTRSKWTNHFQVTCMVFTEVLTKFQSDAWKMVSDWSTNLESHLASNNVKTTLVTRIEPLSRMNISCPLSPSVIIETFLGYSRIFIALAIFSRCSFERVFIKVWASIEFYIAEIIT